MSRHHFLVASGAVLLALSTGAAAAHAQGTGTTKVVKIGVIAPLDAGLTEFGNGIKNSAQLAVDQANARKAIPGWKIEVEAVNDSSDPPTGAASAKVLADDPGVIGVVGPYNSGVSQAALPVLAPAGLALISPSNTLTSLTLGDDLANPARPYNNYFRMVASDAHQAPFLADRAYALGARNIAVVSETKAVSKGLADAFATAFKAKGGKVTVQQVVPDGATDFKDFLTAALPTKPDVIFFGGEYQVGAGLRQQATTAGFTKPIMGGDGIKDPAYITGAGASSKGDLASTVGTPLASLKTAKKFLTAYKKAGFKQPPTDYGPYAYDAANLEIAAAAKALKGQTSIPADARSTVVTEVQNANTKGASGPITFDQYGDTKQTVFTLYKVSGPKTQLAFVPTKP